MGAFDQTLLDNHGCIVTTVRLGALLILLLYWELFFRGRWELTESTLSGRVSSGSGGGGALGTIS